MQNGGGRGERDAVRPSKGPPRGPLSWRLGERGHGKTPKNLVHVAPEALGRATCSNRRRTRSNSPAAHTEVWIPLLARRNNLRVNLRQRLSTLHLLWRSHHNWPDAMHYDSNTRLGAAGNKTRLFACRRNLRAGVKPIRCGLSGGRLSLRWCGFCQRWASAEFMD